MDWEGAHVVIIGAARQGTALARYLAGRGAQVVLNDRRAPDELQAARAALEDLPVLWELGGHPLSLLDGADLVCPSGGVPLTLPLVQEAVALGIPLSNDSQVFLEEALCTVVGVTGSAGKTTVTTLVGRMAEAASNAHSHSDNVYRKVWVGGNIGSPLIADIDQMRADDLAVMELSSFQLEIMTKSPQVAAILNITPNHLDRHGTMEVYTIAKKRILDYQSLEDVAVLGREDAGAWGLRTAVKGRLLSFGGGELEEGQIGTFVRDGYIWLRDEDGEKKVMPLEAIRLRGEHNLLNVLAACAISAAAGIPVEGMRAGVEGFTGVEHRLEFVRHWGGADWYNDSIATAPERSIAAIQSFDAPLVLLAGGRDKDLPWEAFGALVRQRVDHLVLFGEAVGIIRKAVGEVPSGERPYTIAECEGLREAVDVAAGVVEDGDVVLLAPGGASFDEFVDFEERGRKFKEWVRAL